MYHNLFGSYIAVKNNKIITSKDIKQWTTINGNFNYKNKNQWTITYESEYNGIINIIYKNGQYTLVSKIEKLYSDDGINWINKTL